MTVRNSRYPTLLDIAKMLDPDGKPARLINMLTQVNPMFDDMPFFEGNLETGHRATLVTSLPAPAYRAMNEGVLNTKGTTDQVDFGCALLNDFSSIDVELANLGGNSGMARLNNAQLHLEGMAQKAASTFFYGNSRTSPKEFTGMAYYYSDAAAESGENMIDAGGAGSDNSSIYLVGWGMDKVFGIYPKGSQVGLQHKDHGIQIEQNAGGVTGAQLSVFKDEWIWRHGLVVADWRFAARAHSIDISNLTGGGAADIINLMSKLWHRIHNINVCKPVYYMNRTIFQFLDEQRYDGVKAGGGITYENVDGKAIPFFRGIPIKITDALLETEANI